MNINEIAKALGSKGGLKTKEKYGIDHFKKLAQLSVEARKAKKNQNLT